MKPTRYPKIAIEFEGKSLASVLEQIAKRLRDDPSIPIEQPHGAISYNYESGPGDSYCVARIILNAEWEEVKR